MDFTAFFALPVWVSMPVFVLGFLALSWAVLLAVRPWVRRVASNTEEWDRVLGYAMSSYGLFYGILLALIAVSVYENYQRVDEIVLREASAIAALYRDVSAYPAPLSEQLTDLLRQYTQAVVTVDWPQLKAGIIPGEGDATVSAFQQKLFAFEPEGTSQLPLHAATLEQFNAFISARRARLDEAKLGLPGLLWVLVSIGAILNALMIALVETRNLRVHLIMAGIIALFVALLIYTTASMDHPYAGLVGVSNEPYENLLVQLMRQ